MKITQAQLEAICLDLSKQIRRLREARGWTIGRLADSMGISYNGLGRLERGDAAPTYQTLVKIFAVYDIDFAGMVKTVIDEQVEIWEKIGEKELLESKLEMVPGCYIQATKTVPGAITRGELYTVGENTSDSIHLIGDNSLWTWQPKDYFRKVILDDRS